MQDLISPLNPTAIREWISFCFLIVGGSIALRTYVINQRQRRLENSFRLINFFKESLQENDIEEWRKMFYAVFDAKDGHYVSEEKGEQPLSDLFDVPPPDNGATARMAEQFELLSQEILVNTVNLKLVYFELGQFMNYVHQWLKSIDNSDRKKPFIEEYFQNFDKMYKRNSKKFEKWSYKSYASYC